VAIAGLILLFHRIVVDHCYLNKSKFASIHPSKRL
jgi:hypothetical protein